MITSLIFFGLGSYIENHPVWSSIIFLSCSILYYSLFEAILDFLVNSCRFRFGKLVLFNDSLFWDIREIYFLALFNYVKHNFVKCQFSPVLEKMLYVSCLIACNFFS